MSIVIQESLRAVFYAPFYVALSSGAYREEGVDVRFTSSPTPDDAAKRVLAGDVDVTWGGPMRVMQAYETIPDCDIVCFCEVVTRDPFFLVGATPAADFRLPDLKGKTLATVSEVPTPWICLQQDLRDLGIDPGSIECIAGRSMAANTQALRQRELDVVQLFEPYVEELLSAGDGYLWHTAATRGPTSYTTLYTTRRTLDARRDELKRMVRAIHRTQKWIHSAPIEAFAGAIAEFFPAVPFERLVRALDRYRAAGIWGRTPGLPRQGYERLRQSIVTSGFARGVPYERGVDNSLADEVVAEDPPMLAPAFA